MTALAVGFDLDMTLVDSREGITRTLRAALAEAGAPVAAAEVWPHIGIPLLDTIGALAPHLDPEPVAARYRELHHDLAVPATTALEGAREALDAVRAAGGRAVVVSAKPESAVRDVLEHVGLVPDAVHGGLFAEEKGAALLAEGATAYVGDHPGDVRAARAAGAVAVAVATGPHDSGALRAAGADVVLASLRELPAWLDEHALDLRLAALERRLRELGSVLVALSGGADSALVLAAAVRALGAGRVAAATAVSDSLAGGELEGARALAERLGVRLLTPRTAELEREGYRANGGDRCFHCKAELLDVLRPLAAEHGLAAVATGTNADDVVAGFRPGIRAAAERGAATPLLDAGLTKAQVRAASRRWGLPTADKPAAACLSSRIAYGVSITPARLARVDRAEAAARDALAAAGLDVADLRVRDLGEGSARLEVDAAVLEAAAGEVGAPVRAAVAAQGFERVEVRAFRSGSMNALLPDPERYR